jgi:hypothetical protein
MLLALTNSYQYFDWVMAGLITANIVLFGVLTFFPGIHNKITDYAIRFFKKL